MIENNNLEYLKQDASFIVSSLNNPLISHLLIKTYEQGLLSTDKKT